MVVRQEGFLERTTGLVVLTLVFVACIRIIWPFLGAILWSAIIVVATWPLYLRLRERLADRRRLATGIMTACLALVLLGPVLALSVSLSEHISSVSHVFDDLASVELPEEPPEWVNRIPLVGGRLAATWREVSTDMEGFEARLRPKIPIAARWLLSQGASLGIAALQLLLVLLLSALLYSKGEVLSSYVRSFAARLGGGQSLDSLEIATQTIKGVSLGIIGTAVIQAALSGFGFWLADIPGWILLSFFCFATALLQVGTGLIWIPVAGWLFYQDTQGWAVFTVVLGIFINTVDNFIKPYLISQAGASLPVALIFMGVVGGLLTWGIIGIFLGPTLLAIGYSLLKAWLEQEAADAPAAG